VINPSIPRHAALARLILARDDFGRARDIADYILRNSISKKDFLYSPLSYASIVCYACPFIQSRNYARLPNRYCRFDDLSIQKTHDTIIDHRNNFVAHRDTNQNPVSLVPAGTVLTWEGGSGILPDHGDSISTKQLNEELWPKFLFLINLQIQKIDEHIAIEKSVLFPVDEETKIKINKFC
jgi:hypothetical protein